MKNTIGSLSALIALSAAAASAGIVASPFANEEVALTNGYSLDIDMNGDAINDFTIYGNAGGSIVGETETGNEIFVVDDIDFNAKPFVLGEEINLSETGAETANLDNLVGEGFSYVGVKFQAGGQTNLGWMQFFLPDSSTGVLVRGAWENTPGNGIPAGGGSADVTPANGPFAGGNTALITNAAPHIGNGSDITNLVIGEIGTTDILGQGTNWVSFIMPPAESAGVKDIVIQSTSVGETTLAGAYTVNPAGQIGWLAVQVTPADGTWQLNTPTGYTGPTSGTGNLVAVSAVTGQYSLAWGALSGYVAPSNQSQFITGGSTTLFTAVYLQISTNIGTPSGVTATEGTYTNRIRITWQGVAGAPGYEIWRSQTNDTNTAVRIADIPENSPLLIRISDDLKGRAKPPAEPQNKRLTGDGSPYPQDKPKTVYGYDDYNINPINAYYYWVRAKTATLISPMSYVGVGYTALDPSRATGSADIGVSDFVFLPVNITNLSHPGTMSCWIQNHGPDNLANSAVQMDIYMTNNTTPAAWIGNAQTNLSLNAGQEKVIILSLTDKQGISIRRDLSGTGLPEIHIRHLTTINDPNPANNTAYGAGVMTVKSGGVNSPARTINDYDGDGKSDLAVCATNMSVWGVLLSGTRYRNAVVVEPGQTEWIAVPGDYEGVGRTGVGVYVPAYGFWYVWFSSGGGHGQWCFLGGPEYEPVQADYDGDNKTDPAVYSAGEGYWRGYESGSGYAAGETWVGGLGYEPVVRDYDGDGKADPMTYAERTGIWIGQLTGTQYGLVSAQFGGYGYQAVSADFDGDGKADPAVYDLASGRLFAWLSSAGYVRVNPVTSFQVSVGDLPVAGDFDGDRFADPGVFNAKIGAWYIWLSSAGYYRVGPVLCGLNANDIPVPADYDGDSKTDPAVYQASSGGWYVWLSGAAYIKVGPFPFHQSSADIPAPGQFDVGLLADPAVYQQASGVWYIWLSNVNYLRIGPITFSTTDDHLPVPADYDGDGLCDPASYVPALGKWRIWMSGNNYALTEMELR